MRLTTYAQEVHHAIIDVLVDCPKLEITGPTKHTVKVALTVDSDLQTAQNRLDAAVETVYQGYRQRIER